MIIARIEAKDSGYSQTRSRPKLAHGKRKGVQMGEYRYYAFQASDMPLTQKEMERLGAVGLE